MKDTVGTLAFLAGSWASAWWVNRLIAPWPQWAVVAGFLILVVLIAGVALVVGLAFGR